VVKAKFGNFGRIFGNSNSEDGVGKNIGDEEAEKGTQSLPSFPETKPNM
jgi:hypothetical protein